ncbi:MAG: hypothetical protein AMXMBFR53_25380 [Gemmatimonadota bacterium]
MRAARKAGTVAVLAAAVLAGPANAQTGPAGPVEVPLRTHGGRLIVPVKAADGAQLDFILTTGSGVTVLSESAARRLGEGAALTLGGLPVPMDGAQTVPDASLRTSGRDFAGMIGPNMLNAFDILVDVPGRRLVLKPVGRAVSWEGVALSEPVRLRVYHGIVLGLDVELNGKPYPAMLDLGTPGVLVNARVFSEAAVTGGRASLELGARTFADVPTEATDHPAIQRFSPNGDGFVLVGSAVALECAVSVSWVHRELRTCVR